MKALHTKKEKKIISHLAENFINLATLLRE